MIHVLFENPILFFIQAICLILAIGIHEFAHAATADHLGDPTPRVMGRVTLNPLAHLDRLGTLFMLFFGFGWGKPVQFDPFNLKDPRRDSALISIAGPLSNLALAMLSAIIIKLLTIFANPIVQIIGYYFLYPLLMMNIILAVFNLIPIHPLDGFKIVGGFLSHEKAREWYQLERYGMIFLLILIFPINGHSMLDTIFNPVFQGLQYLRMFLFS
jgi:Zn-dependent protease